MQEALKQVEIQLIRLPQGGCSGTAVQQPFT
jgi:hypothetical protein